MRIEIVIAALCVLVGCAGTSRGTTPGTLDTARQSGAPVGALDVTSSAIFGFACRVQVRPVPPDKAVVNGVSGLVKAQATIKRGKVTEVTILSGPRIFHPAVLDALMKYQCDDNGETLVVVQEFRFALERPAGPVGLTTKGPAQSSPAAGAGKSPQHEFLLGE